MEYIVEPSTRRQLEFICDITDSLKYLESPVELRTQFPMAGNVQRCDQPVDETKPDPITLTEF
jgi:hypothetical protein